MSGTVSPAHLSHLSHMLHLPMCLACPPVPPAHLCHLPHLLHVPTCRIYPPTSPASPAKGGIFTPLTLGELLISEISWKGKAVGIILSVPKPREPASPRLGVGIPQTASK